MKDGNRRNPDGRGFENENRGKGKGPATPVACLSSQNVQTGCVSVKEIEYAVASLSPSELAAFAQWFENFVADEWDKQIEADARSGKLDHLARRADEHFDAGRCTPL